MEDTKIEIGKTYNVVHQRKGRFTICATADDGEWVTGVITNGTANAVLDYNVKEQGETITMRRSLCRFTLVEGEA